MKRILMPIFDDDRVRNLGEWVVRHGVTLFVNTLTDEALNHTAIVCTSTRVVEMIVSAASRNAVPGPTCVSLRFGNVLGSRGSAVPILEQPIAQVGP